MEDDKHVAHDGDSDLSFESLTFGDSHNDHHHDKNGQQGLKKKDKFRKKFSNKKEPPHTPEGEKSSSVYITTQDDKLDVQALLRKLEHFGAVRGYYFKEKQNFGIVQFVDPSIVEAVIESFSTGDSGFRVTVERTSRAKDFHASPHSFGSIPPSLTSTPVVSSINVTSPTFSTPPPPEKPDTILVLKNLPFTLKQDQLHEILLSLSTTIPQSISLHYDNGVFKGMAFIKYRQIEDAIQVYELLNGMDVGGRKVRVEYKRKPAAKALADIPVEWQEDEELRKLWEQLKEFKEDSSQTEWYHPPTLTINQRRNIYNMTERLKLVQGTSSDGELRVYLRKTPNPISPTPDHGHNHSGSVDNKGRGIDIKARRTRHDSDAASRSGAASPNDRDRMGRNSVGRNEGNKHSIASSAPADMNLDWRSNQSPSGSYSNSYNSHAQFAHNMQIHHQQQQHNQQVPQQAPMVAPVRQPKGPDGSKGFDAPRKLTTCAFLISSNTTEVSAS